MARHIAPARMDTDKRHQDIIDVILNYASGNFERKGLMSERNDELDAIIMGINMLGEELRASTVHKDYLESIYEGVVDMLLIVNPDNTIQTINRTVINTLGYTEHELRGKALTELFADDESISLKEVNQKLLSKGFLKDFEKTFQTRDRRYLPVSCSCSILHDSKSNFNGILYVVKDVSTLKEAQMELKQKNEELNNFIYKASHNFKGPLASTVGLLNLAENEMNNLGAVRNYLKLIKTSVSKLEVLVDDLLVLGRVKQMPFQYSYVSFSEIIEQILISFQHLPDYSQLDFIREIEEDVKIVSDRKIIYSALQNIVENAIKYRNRRAARPFLRITIKTSDKGAELIFEDNGMGIAQEYQEKVFDMFYRCNPEVEGTGLGLFIVKSSIEKLGGTIDLDSTPNRGTTFHIRIPSHV